MTTTSWMKLFVEEVNDEHFDLLGVGIAPRLIQRMTTTVDHDQRHRHACRL